MPAYSARRVLVLLIATLTAVLLVGATPRGAIWNSDTAAVLADDTCLAHRYDADSAGTDSVGSAPVALANGAAYAAGIAGQAFSFDGVDDKATSAATNAMDALPMTLAAWVKPELRSDGTGFPANVIPSPSISPPSSPPTSWPTTCPKRSPRCSTLIRLRSS